MRTSSLLRVNEKKKLLSIPVSKEFCNSFYEYFINSKITFLTFSIFEIGKYN